MIARIWHGWTSRDNAEAYDRLLQETILPGIRRVPGYLGAQLLRRPVPDGEEFVTVTYFESLDAVRTFAGPDYETAVVPEAARALLARFDAKSRHYTVAAERL